MNNANNRFFFPNAKLRIIGPLILSMISTLTGCYYPKAVDDFDVLGKDVLSDLLRNSYESENGLSASGNFDKLKLKSLAENLFMGKERNSIQATFSQNKGECISGAMRDSMTCNFFRKWRLKNIGAPFDTSNWSEPAAKIEIRFVFDERGKMQNLSLEVISVTERKKIRG